MINRRWVAITALLVALMSAGTTAAQTSSEITNRAKSTSAAQLPELRRQAEAGDTTSQLVIGLMYEKGYVVAKDAAQAVAWYRRAASANNFIAQVWLGDMFAWGDGVAKSDSEATAWYRRAADNGSASGAWKTGERAAVGVGTPQDLREAARWFRKARSMDSKYDAFPLVAGGAESCGAFCQALRRVLPEMNRNFAALRGAASGSDADRWAATESLPGAKCDISWSYQRAMHSCRFHQEFPTMEKTFHPFLGLAAATAESLGSDWRLSHFRYDEATSTWSAEWSEPGGNGVLVGTDKAAFACSGSCPFAVSISFITRRQENLGAAAASAPSGFQWVARGRGDCTAHDARPLSRGNSPEPSYCDGASVGRAAICWDGGAERNQGSAVAQCTYKDLTPAACRGGGNPGTMYECVRN